MAIERVREYLKGFDADSRIIELDESSATVDLAAKALGVEGARIAKTLSFIVDEKPILIVVAGDAKVNNKKFRERFGIKPRMIEKDLVEKLIGHDVGGVCPFGVNKGVNIFLDVSIKRFKTLFPACGSSNSAIELEIPEFEKFIQHSGWVDVCKIPEEE